MDSRASHFLLTVLMYSGINRREWKAAKRYACAVALMRKNESKRVVMREGKSSANELTHFISKLERMHELNTAHWKGAPKRGGISRAL